MNTLVLRELVRRVNSNIQDESEMLNVPRIEVVQR